MEIFENEYSKMWIEDGILYVKYVPYIVVTLDIAAKSVSDRLEFCKGKTYPMLGDSRVIKDIDKSARAYLATEEAVKGISAGAFLIKTQIEKFVGNLWLKVDKPKVPARLFVDEQEAIEWLKNYRSSKLN